MPDTPDTPDTPERSAASPSARRRRALAWLLPPILAGAAVLVQFALDVPRHEMVPREDESPSLGPGPDDPVRTTTAARTPKQWRARTPEEIDALRETWSGRAIQAEPRDPRYRKHHEPLLRAVVRKAEVDFVPADDPVSMLVRANCHTIRCSLEICAEPKVVEGVAERIPNFKVGARSLWHELREIGDEPRPDPRGKGQVCRRWIVDFAVEGADVRYLRLVR
jgi:hypothetical protein